MELHPFLPYVLCDRNIDCIFILGIIFCAFQLPNHITDSGGERGSGVPEALYAILIYISTFADLLFIDVKLARMR